MRPQSSLTRSLVLVVATVVAQALVRRWLDAHPRTNDLVDEVLDESFPASDPPPWTAASGGASAGR